MNDMSPVHAPAVVRNPVPFSAPRVALVHYWLVTLRGGERVLERMLKLYPGADIFTHVYNPAAMSRTIREANVHTSFISRLPYSQRFYKHYLPLMPYALEHFDLTGYDLVISSESGPAKGVITHPDSLHACYCHSPMRYLWDHFHQYRTESGPLVRLATSATYKRLRQWDVDSSARVDRFAANSNFIRNRIRKFWRREAEVIHPPVETDLFSPSDEVGDYYLWTGQMVPYKRPDLAVDAFNANGRPLLMVGTGSMLKALKARAKPNITFVDRMDFKTLRQSYAQARAFVMTAEEDFGITPVESMASGRPVVAYGRGGARDSVVPDRTGIFFHRQDADALAEAVEEMERFLPHFDPANAVAQANRFAPDIFDEKMLELTSLG